MKTFLQRTISCLIIFVCLLACVSVKQVVSASDTNCAFDFTKIGDFTLWSNSYTKHSFLFNSNSHQVKFTFSSASYQRQTITNMPVTKAADLTIELSSEDIAAGYYISSFTVKFKQWTTKTQNVKMSASSNGSTYTEIYAQKALSFSTDGAKISQTLSDQTYKYLKISTTNTSNQVGWAGIDLVISKNDNATSADKFSQLDTLASLNLGWTSEEVTSSSVDTWKLVTDASELAEGDQIIIAAKDYNYALSTTQNGNNRGQAAIVKNDKNVEFENNVQVLTLKTGKTSGTFGFYTGSGYLYAASSSSNYLRTETTLSTNSSWKISVTSAGVATIIAQGSNSRNTMQYNQSSSLFACYSSGSQKALSIYKKYVEEGLETVHSIKEGSVALRFGTLVPAEIYEDLLSQGYKFGVNFVSGTKNKDFICANVEKVTVEDKEYYQYAVVINNIPVSAYKEEFTATCFAELNGEQVKMNSKTHSVVSILTAYVEMAESSEEYYGSLDKDLMAGLLTAASK